jgi:hypothetical protein
MIAHPFTTDSVAAERNATLSTLEECREVVAANPLCHPSLMSMDRQAAFLAAFVRTTAPAVAVAE